MGEYMNESINKAEIGVPTDLFRQQMGNLFYKTNIIVNLMNNEMRENT
jgi:hypothetical protein